MQPKQLFHLGPAKRPLWRNYLTAYLLIGGGFLLGDIAGVRPGNRLLEIAGAAIFFTGLLVFVAALAHSIWFVMSGKPPRSGAA